MAYTTLKRSGKVYDFSSQLEIGKKGEEKLDRYFSQGFHVIKVSLDVEVDLKIDRIFIRRHTGRKAHPDILKIEYKLDITATRTDNIFIELEVVGRATYPGWISSKADFLAYYVPPKAYVIPMRRMREIAAIAQGKYPEKICQNNGYAARGILYPLDKIRAEEKVVILEVGEL